MSKSPRGGPERAQAFLVERFGSGVSAVESLTGGAWSEAFGYQVGGEDFVVRFSAIDEDFRKDERAARFASAALPVPRMVEIGETFDGFFAITERRSGTFLETVDGSQLTALLPALFAAFDAMRVADISDTTGFGSWGSDGEAWSQSWRHALLNVARDAPTLRIHGWSERMAASPIGAGPFREGFAALERLTENLPGARHLIHSDLINRNALVDGSRLTAVFDWGSALYGDFVFDLAWLRFWQPWYPAWAEVDLRDAGASHYAAIGLDVPRFEERLRACAVYIGLDGQVYQAFVERWSDLEWTAARTIEVARGT